MKKIIYKSEFEDFCQKSNINEEIKAKLSVKIFVNTLNDPFEYFKLKPELTSIDNLQQIFENILGHKIQSGLKYFSLQRDLDYLPRELSDAITNKEVAVFVGAGISKLFKYNLWDELSNKAMDYLNELGILNFYEADKIKNTIKDPKQKLSIFTTYLKNRPEDWKKFYHDNFDKKDTNTLNGFTNPYTLLCDKTFDFIKISTNIDHEFAYSLSACLNESNLNDINHPGTPNELVLKIEPLDCINNLPYNIQNINRLQINMIHGRVDKLDNIVFTTSDYVNTYFKEDSDIQKFLKHIFSHYTVLFLGYGLEEFPILESIYSSLGKNKHYTMVPTYSSEMGLFHKQEEYYASLGIEAIPYYIDTDGYLRISKVLSRWKEKIEEKNKPNTIFNINRISDFLKNE